MKQAEQNSLYYVNDQEHLTSKQLDEIKKNAYNIAVNSSEEMKSRMAKLQSQNDEDRIWSNNAFIAAYIAAKKRLVANAYHRSPHHAANMELFKMTNGEIGYTGFRSAPYRTR